MKFSSSCHITKKILQKNMVWKLAPDPFLFFIFKAKMIKTWKNLSKYAC